MERDELECFLILAEELHFGRTAVRMRLSRARVSQLIQRLERRLGAPLFERTSRTVALTELGERFRDDVEPHHRAIEQAVARTAAAARGIGGTLRIGFTNSLTGEIAMKAADDLRGSYPELAVEICEMSFTDPFTQLRDRYYDVQFMELPVREDDLAKGPTLLTEGRVLAVAADHPLAARPWLTMEDLAETAAPRDRRRRPRLPPRSPRAQAHPERPADRRRARGHQPPRGSHARRGRQRRHAHRCPYRGATSPAPASPTSRSSTPRRSATASLGEQARTPPPSTPSLNGSRRKSNVAAGKRTCRTPTATFPRSDDRPPGRDGDGGTGRIAEVTAAWPVRQSGR